MQKLTGHDYMNRPMLELQSHPDFSSTAFTIIARMAKMTTEEIEEINLFGGTNV